MKRLIRYSETPQVTGLEYDEIAYLKKHPERKEFYEQIVRYRTESDKASYFESMRGLRR